MPFPLSTSSPTLSSLPSSKKYSSSNLLVRRKDKKAMKKQKSLPASPSQPALQIRHEQQQRIPESLQKIFLSSNRGNEVDQPPEGNVAFNVFSFRRKNLDSKGKKKGNSRNIIDEKSNNDKSNNSTVTKINDRESKAIFTKKKRNSRNSNDKKCNDDKKINNKQSDSIFTKKKSVKSFSNSVKIQESNTSSTTAIKRTNISPQEYLDDQMYIRGYATLPHQTLKSGYYKRPTLLQQASYDNYLIELALYGQNVKLRRILDSGISPNPCNSHGESLIHLISRRCLPSTMQVFLNAGASVRVSDDYGRTPLHDACWRPEPCFEMIHLIAKSDRDQFHMQDERGSRPLSYVRREQWDMWISFIDSKIDAWWDPCNDDIQIGIPELSRISSSPKTIPDPKNSLRPQIAAMVAANKLSPEEAISLHLYYSGRRSSLSEKAESTHDFTDATESCTTDYSENEEEHFENMKGKEDDLKEAEENTTAEDDEKDDDYVSDSDDDNDDDDSLYDMYDDEISDMLSMISISEPNSKLGRDSVM